MIVGSMTADAGSLQMLRIKVKQYGNNYRSQKIKYRNYWADHILPRECQSSTYVKVTEGIINDMIHGFDNIILACGPHCSGKTFNIMGWNHEYEGIVLKLIEEMFAVQNRQPEGVYEMSCVEIKNNRVFDLLNDSKRSCLLRDVSKHKIDSSLKAKRMLWEANAKRTVIKEKEIPSHVYDFAITIYYSRSKYIGESKRAKVRIVELAGVGPNAVKLLKHQIQVNRTMLEFSQFLKHVKNSHNEDNYDAKKKFVGSTLTLLKYCQSSFLKQNTTLRVLCHIRPEAAYLDLNISVLNFGEVLRKLPTNELSLSIVKPENIEIHKQIEHSKYELQLYKRLKGYKSMVNMTVERYENLRTMVLNFLQCKSDDIVLPNWNFVEVFTVLFIFKEYYDKLMTDNDNEKIANCLESAPFSLKCPPFDKVTIRKTVENVGQTVSAVLSLPAVTRPSEMKYWNAFVTVNSQNFREMEKLSAEIRDAYRLLNSEMENMFAVQEELLRTRDRMDRLRRKRHLSGDEQYDKNMNIIVPAEEKHTFQTIRQVDTRAANANEIFVRVQNHLNQILATYSKLNVDTQISFKEFLDIQRSATEIKEVKSRFQKSAKNLAENPKAGRNHNAGLIKKVKSRI